MKVLQASKLTQAKV